MPQRIVHQVIHYITHPTETMVSVGTGGVAAGGYLQLHLGNIILQISSMSIIDFSITCFKTAVIATLGGFCGLLGKALFAWIKEKCK